MGKTIKILCVLFLLAAAAGCRNETPAVTPSGRSVRIGVIGPMSGPSRALGQDTLKGIKTSLAMNPYLKNGDKIELIVEDDQNDPKSTVKAFKKLVLSGKVTAILLLSSSSSCLAAKAVADAYKTPVLVVLGTHPKITEKTRFVSQLCFDNTFQGKVAALFVHDELLLDRAAVFTDPDSFYSSSLVDEFVKQFMKIGGDVTDIISIKGGQKDLMGLLAAVRKHDPELLYLPIGAKYAIPVLDTIQRMVWYPECMAGEGLISEVRSQFRDDIHLFDGLLAVDFYSSTIPLTPFGKRAVRKFRKLYRERGNTFAALGIEGMEILRSAMNHCEPPENRLCVNEKIRNTNNFEGIMGKITIRPNGKAERPLIVNRIRNGRIIGVVKVY